MSNTPRKFTVELTEKALKVMREMDQYLSNNRAWVGSAVRKKKNRRKMKKHD